mgnify:CR=1 FL=1
MIFLALLLAAVVAALLTRRFCDPASGLHLLDLPNARSLHTRPTPRSGGIALDALQLVSLAPLTFGPSKILCARSRRRRYRFAALSPLFRRVLRCQVKPVRPCQAEERGEAERMAEERGQGDEAHGEAGAGAGERQDRAVLQLFRDRHAVFRRRQPGADQAAADAQAEGVARGGWQATAEEVRRV